MNKSPWKPVAAISLTVVAAGMVVDQMRRAAALSPPPRATTPPQAPPGARDPASAAIHPSGKEWAAYLRRSPLSVGALAPSFVAKEGGGRIVRLPQKDLPSVWMVLCGCPDCARTGYHGWELSKRLNKQAHFVYFVANTTEYVWERMTMSFNQATDLVWDKTGSYYRILRAPGATYSRLPMVWGIDHVGRIRCFSRPTGSDEKWEGEIVRRLGLKPAPDHVWRSE